MIKENYSDKPDLQTLATKLQNMQAHATIHGVSTIAIPKIGCGLDQMNWQDVAKLLRNVFAYSEIQIVVYSLDEHVNHAMSAQGDPEFYAEDETDRYSEEFYLNERELETDLWEDLSINLDKYVGQRTNQMHPSTRLILNIVQSTPLARPKMIRQIRQAPAMTQTTSVQILKMTTLFVISVSKLTKPDFNKPNKLTT